MGGELVSCLLHRGASAGLDEEGRPYARELGPRSLEASMRSAVGDKFYDNAYRS